MSGKLRSAGLYLPPTLPPLILVPTGETIKVDGKHYRILKIERAKHSDVSYKLDNKKKP